MAWMSDSYSLNAAHTVAEQPTITFLEQRMAELSPEEEQELTRNLSLVGLLTGSGATKVPGTGLLSNIILGLLGLKTTVAR
ncbi:hypothetical protein B566_EDAN013296 [Ephemera danica]|nr:hypothetical protein B566_EDAN013296 [Ephemera danica]